MKRQDFHYDLPQGLIAQRPPEKRGASRMLCLDAARGGAVTHRKFADLPGLLRPGDLLVFNDTRVIPARIFGNKRSGGKVEILIERILEPRKAAAHMRNAPKTGDVVILEDGSVAAIEGRDGDLFLLAAENAWLEIMNSVGRAPLPPYITRAAEAKDRERYQTIYARNSGAAAAPTAGLHFNEAIMAKISAKGANFAFVTLHVGAGTFQPVRAENIADHKMHSEHMEVGEEACAKIADARKNGGRVVAVGTTSLRCLETAQGRPYVGETDIFIYPGYEFKSTDALITNFHLPESTLLMLVCAFAGYENVLRAYREAVAEKYGFFSYGDAMFITR